MRLNTSESKGLEVESEVGKGSCFSFVIDNMEPDNSFKQNENPELSQCDVASVDLNEDGETDVKAKINMYAAKRNENYYKLEPTPEIANQNQSKTPELKGNIPTLEVDEAEDVIKRWCLIVDDNPFNLMVASHIMQQRNYEVKTALNGQEAIQVAREHAAQKNAFKVILMDINMPVMDGYQATNLLKEMMKNGEISECPIIAVTVCKGSPDDERMCKEVGMNGVLGKPLQIDELEAALKEAE